MTKTFTFLFAIIISLTSYGQFFEGKIVYKNTFKELSKYKNHYYFYIIESNHKIKFNKNNNVIVNIDYFKQIINIIIELLSILI